MSNDTEQTILIVDDEKNTVDSISVNLLADGFTNVQSTTDPTKTLELVRKHKPTLVLLDLIMPKMSGLEVLQSIKSEFQDQTVIMVTGINDLQKAVECMRAGAYDYLTKPLTQKELVHSVRHAINETELSRENVRLKQALLSYERPAAFEQIITTDNTMKRVFSYCTAIAPSKQPVLVTGETGTGKDLLARAIHEISRPDQPFMQVNIAGVDELMVSDTLFGHVKGAYTLTT